MEVFLAKHGLYANDYQLEEENQCSFRQWSSNSSRTDMSDYPLGLHFPQQSHRRCGEPFLSVVRLTFFSIYE